MIKKCIGCGIVLQTSTNTVEGYTENISNDVCERCFRLKNYGEYKEVTLENETYKKILLENKFERRITRDSSIIG